MLDINKIRNNLNLVKKQLSKRNSCWNKIIDDVHKLDKDLCNIQLKAINLNTQKNKLSKKIANIKIKKNIKMFNQYKKNADKIKKESIWLNKHIQELKIKLKNKLLNIPNIPHISVPIGKDKDDNKIIHHWSNPTKFTFKPKAHWDLAVENNLIDFNRAIKLTGSRFVCYTGNGAKLLRALIQYTLDLNTNAGFQEMLPSVILNANTLIGTGQLPKFEDDLFKLTNGYYLSPTAEVQLTNYYANEILSYKLLPIKFTANTCCFRSEAGSAGKDTKGVIRQHQFYKTEMVILTNINDSYKCHEFMTRQAEKILERLKLPYRRILLCTGDMGFSASKTYDIEVWLPSINSYKEISSCSNCEDYQARRMMLRYKDKNDHKYYAHTLNGSGLAIDRLWAAIIENYQQKDGSIKVPIPLQKYMNNLKVISHNKK